ncbi:MAG: hypothetical protein Q4G63_12790 [Bacteroidia bacterium]|nr:hypothetical protein [Bacteroidia bacterium]
MKQEKQIELRSEKVRNIIGKIPSTMVRYGTVFIGLALFSILVVSVFVPYRETIPIKISVEKTNSLLFGKAVVSKAQLPKISLGNKVIINDPLLGYVEASVTQMLIDPLPDDGFMREIVVTFIQQPTLNSLVGNDIMEGQIILSDMPILKKILQSLGF